MNHNYVRKPNCKCKECGKEIYRRPFQLAKGGPYCSTKCSNIRNKKEDPKCVICEVLILRREHAITCSRKCSNKYRKGIVYKIGRPQDKSLKIRRAKEMLVLERGAKCNRCTFNVVEVLHVHHIVEKCNGGTDYDSNLQLLCPNCHALHHFLNKTRED